MTGILSRTTAASILRGTIVKQEQILLVEIGKYVGFCVYRRSYQVFRMVSRNINSSLDSTSGINTKFFNCRSFEITGKITTDLLCVLHIKPFFLPIIQHNQCPCRFFNPINREVPTLWSQNYQTAEILEVRTSTLLLCSTRYLRRVVVQRNVIVLDTTGTKWAV